MLIFIVSDMTLLLLTEAVGLAALSWSFVERTRATAISHAFGIVRTEFVARLDYDDRYHPNLLVDSIDALQS
jgi:hypothetical protein